MYLLLGWFAATPALVAPGRRNRLLAIAAGQLPRTKARSPRSHPIGRIHCALRAHLPASSRNPSLEQNLRESSLWALLNSPIRRKVLRDVLSVAISPSIGTSSCSARMGATRADSLEWCAGGACVHFPPTVAYGWKSAPNAPRIGPRVSPTPNASPVRLQLPMMPSGPSASWPTNIPSSSEASAAVVSPPTSTL